MIKRFQNVVSMSIFTECIAYFITTIHRIKTTHSYLLRIRLNTIGNYSN